VTVVIDTTTLIYIGLGWHTFVRQVIRALFFSILLLMMLDLSLSKLEEVCQRANAYAAATFECRLGGDDLNQVFVTEKEIARRKEELRRKLVQKLQAEIDALQTQVQGKELNDEESDLYAAVEQENTQLNRLEKELEQLEKSNVLLGKESTQLEAKVVALKSTLQEKESALFGGASSKMEMKKTSVLHEKRDQLERQVALLEQCGAKAVPDNQKAASAAEEELKHARFELENLLEHQNSILLKKQGDEAQAYKSLETLVRTCCKDFDRQADVSFLKSWVNSSAKSDTLEMDVAGRAQLAKCGLVINP